MADEVWIVGSAGFIGRHLRAHLAARPGASRVVCIDQEPHEAVGEREMVLTARLGEPQEEGALFDRLLPHAASCRGIVFLAAWYDFRNRPHPGYGRIERGFEVFLDWALAHVPASSPFVFTSSMAALAPTEPGVPIGPEGPRSAAWAYPASKRRCEDILESRQASQPRVELVLAGVYSDDGELVPLFHALELARERRLERLFYPADPDRGLTYVHVDDVCRAIVAALERPLGPGLHRVMIGEPTPLTQRELMDIASQAWNLPPWRPLRVPRWLAALGAWLLATAARLRGRDAFYQPWMMRFAGEHFELDLSDARRRLGWKPEHSIHRELPKILERAARNPQRWLQLNRRRPR